jgi:murein DD-endopeptidase MepM/ murein hydrolase activator NlpD
VFLCYLYTLPGKKEEMSLNLRISRPRPRRSRSNLYWLLGAIVFASGWIAWFKSWHPDDVLAYVNQQVLSQVPVEIPQLQLQAEKAVNAQAAPQVDTVQMVESRVIENPQSDAFTAGLYTATGKDDIPWPNIDGRTKVEIYTVQDGDSLWSISANFGLDIDTLRWSNPELERNPDVLSVGTELRILPITGAYHDVTTEDTLESIAVKYGVDPDDITGYPPNAMFPPFEVQPGDGLIIPFGKKDIKLPKPALSPGATLAWPIVGSITTNFIPGHPALDIGAPYGSTVYAADAGTITYSDWAYDGYGYTVIVDHGNGRETWYNHLKGALLNDGAIVERGTPVGEVGSTGHSTGPHIHFEVRINGEPVNPTGYLPGSTPQ